MNAHTLVEASPVTRWWDEDTLPPLRRSVPEWRSIVLDAYDRQPTLRLTMPQAQRLWGMEAPVCTYVLDGLAAAGLLARTVDRQFCRPEFVGAEDPVGLL